MTELSPNIIFLRIITLMTESRLWLPKMFSLHKKVFLFVQRCTLTTIFFDQMVMSLCLFCFQLNSEDTSFIEAVEQFLEGWASLLEHSSLFPKGLFNDSATRILNCYVQCHLAEPDGLRGTFSHQIDSGVHLDEICDLDSDDRELFVDQLCTVGSFGRLIPGHALNLLTKLLETRVNQFEKYLTAVKHSRGMLSINTSINQPFSQIVNQGVFQSVTEGVIELVSQSFSQSID